MDKASFPVEIKFSRKFNPSSFTNRQLSTVSYRTKIYIAVKNTAY